MFATCTDWGFDNIDSEKKTELMANFSKNLEIIENLVAINQFDPGKTEENPVLGFGEVWSSNIVFNLLLSLSEQQPCQVLQVTLI